MAIELFKAAVLVAAGVALAAYGVRILVTGQMVLRRPRRQDSVALQKSSVLEGARAQKRGALLLAVGVAMVLAGAWRLLA